MTAHITHRTDTGYVELIGKWGHGQGDKKHFARMPATLILDDGDGHYSAWRVHGSMRDAAVVLGSLYTGPGPGKVAIHRGPWVTVKDAPDGFWSPVLDDDGEAVEFVARPDLFPGVVAW